MWCCWWNPSAPELAVPAPLGAWKNSSNPRGWWLRDQSWWLSPGDGDGQRGCCPGLGTQGLGPGLVELPRCTSLPQEPAGGLEGVCLNRRMPEIRS